MTYKVTDGDLKSLRFNETDIVKSVMQNISIILATKRGTCPMYREFGLPQKFVDKPIPVAKTMMYAEIKEAVEEYEPRAEVLNVTFTEDSSIAGRLVPAVEVRIKV